MRTLDDFEYQYILGKELEQSKQLKSISKFIFCFFCGFPGFFIIIQTIVGLVSGDGLNAIFSFVAQMIPIVIMASIFPFIIWKFSDRKYLFFKANRNVPCFDGIVRERRVSRHRHDGHTSYHYYLLVEVDSKLYEFSVDKDTYNKKDVGYAVLIVFNSNKYQELVPHNCSVY